MCVRPCKIQTISWKYYALELININSILCLQSNKCETPSNFSGSANPNDMDSKFIRLEISNIRSKVNKWYWAVFDYGSLIYHNNMSYINRRTVGGASEPS